MRNIKPRYQGPMLGFSRNDKTGGFVKLLNIHREEDSFFLDHVK